MPGGSASWKSAGAGSLPDNLPAGLRVLVVDNDPVCLMVMEKMLKKCNYEVIVCNKAEDCLSMLRENRNVCDIVLSDVHMPDMDGFKLLEQIRLEVDIPVIMMSADDRSSVMKKGINHGACDYIIKPVRMEVLRAIWLHVFRRQQKQKDFKALTSADDVDQRQKVSKDVNYNTSSENEGGNWQNAKRGNEYDDEFGERDETSSSKKPRVIWSIELHEKFVEAVNKLGLHRAVPKKILELMKVPGITRENIASHLQKYRLYLKRISGSQQSGSNDTSFLGSLERGYDLRSLEGRSQLPGQNLTPLQTSVLDHLNNSRSTIPMPLMDQKNSFNFGNSRFYGNATDIEPNPFMGLNQSRQYPFNGVNSQALMPMAGQSQSQPFFPNNGMMTPGLGSNSSGGGIVPNFNFLNNSNQIRHDSGSANMTFTDWLSNTSNNKMEPTSSFAVNEESGSHRNDTTDNQDDILMSLLDQPQGGVGQQDNELVFDGYAFDDLPRAT